MTPNHALQRTRPSRSGCSPRASRAGSLSLGWIGVGTLLSGIIALAVFSLIVWWRNRNADQDQDATDEDDVDTMKQDLVLWLGFASLLFSFLTSIPALIIAARARPLATRAKIGATVAIVTLVANVVVPIAIRLLRTD